MRRVHSILGYLKTVLHHQSLLLSIVFVCFSSLVSGQTCNGILGEAIINETFGNRISEPLERGKTTYQFAADRCPNDGEYSLGNSSYCYGGTWHTVPEDHTPGDTDGVMLIVNASHEAGEFYSQSVTGLCQGITYEFSVWVLNLMNPGSTNGCNPIEPVPLDPNITMSIERTDGSRLQTIQTGIIPRTPTPTWVRYSVLFTMPDDGSTVQIKLINNGPGGCGNDLALDDIQFRPCHPALSIRHEGNDGTNLEVCPYTTHLIQSDLGSGYTQPVYQWQESTDGLTWQNIPNATRESYPIQVTYPGQRYYRLVCTQSPNTITEQNTQCRAVSNSLQVTVRPTDECQGPQVMIPDAFSPNADGINDVLDVFYTPNTTFELRIFNRWGSVIFMTDTNGLRWDGTYLGKPCANGVYPWKIKYRSTGSANASGPYFKTGQVVLLR